MVDSVTDSGYNDSTHRTAGIRRYNDVPSYVATDDFEFGAYVASSGPVVINRGESMTTQGVQVGGTITLSARCVA